MPADLRQTAIKKGTRIAKWSRRHAKETEGVGRGRGHGCVHHLELLHTFAFCPGPVRALALRHQFPAGRPRSRHSSASMEVGKQQTRRVVFLRHAQAAVSMCNAQLSDWKMPSACIQPLRSAAPPYWSPIVYKAAVQRAYICLHA
jgi:hypothetical protein